MTFAALLHPLGFGIPAGLAALVALRYADSGRRRRPATQRRTVLPDRRVLSAAEIDRRVRDHRPLPPVQRFL